jgi:DNA-binding transcriptional LysR family regulator
MIDRYQLRYFLAVVDAGNFSRAAIRVNVTQPTLSVGITKLEQHLGTKLFFRNSQRVHLTDAGNRFLVHARAIENEFNQVEQTVSGLQTARLVRLGVLATIPTRLIEQVVGLNRAAARPDRVEILEGTERDLLGYLARGRIDVALTLLRTSPGRFAQEPLFEEGYALAVPAGHRFADAEAVAPDDLAEEVMMVRRQCEALSETSRHFTERGVRPEFSFRSINDDRVLALVRAGLGITVMPDGYHDEGVRRPKLLGFDVRRRIGLLYSSSASDLQTGDSAMIAALRTLTESAHMRPAGAGQSVNLKTA